jgi:hypothetical protein
MGIGLGDQSRGHVPDSVFVSVVSVSTWSFGLTRSFHQNRSTLGMAVLPSSTGTQTERDQHKKFNIPQKRAPGGSTKGLSGIFRKFGLKNHFFRGSKTTFRTRAGARLQVSFIHKMRDQTPRPKTNNLKQEWRAMGSRKKARHIRIDTSTTCHKNITKTGKIFVRLQAKTGIHPCAYSYPNCKDNTQGTGQICTVKKRK